MVLCARDGGVGYGRAGRGETAMNIRVFDEAALGIAAEHAPPRVLVNGTPRHPPLKIAIWRSRRVAVAKLCGSAEMAEAELLAEELGKLADEAAPVVVLDLSELAFIGSPGLTAVVNCHLRMRRNGGQIRLAAPRPAVLKVLQRTRLSDLFPIYRSVEQAIMA